MTAKPRPIDCCPPSAIPTPLDGEQQDVLVAGFKALADPNRLEMFRLIAAQDSMICVCDIVDHFLLTQPTISHHLKVLREAGLIMVSRMGVWAYYSANIDGVATLHRALDDVFALRLEAAV